MFLNGSHAFYLRIRYDGVLDICDTGDAQFCVHSVSQGQGYRVKSHLVPSREEGHQQARCVCFADLIIVLESGKHLDCLALVDMVKILVQRKLHGVFALGGLSLWFTLH